MSALVVHGSGSVTLTVDASATEKRDEAVAFARIVPAPTDEDSLATAVESLRELKAIAKETEESRVAVKRPIDAIAAKIQETARTFLVDVNAQIDRLDAAVNRYEREKREKARKEAAEIERKRLAEEKRQADEKAEVEKATQDAIKANLPPPPPPAPVVVVQPSFSLAPAAPRPKGLSAKWEPRFRVVDAGKLAAEKPEWVTIEPKAREIIAHVRHGGRFEGEQKIGEGLVIYWEDVSNVRV